MTKFREQHTRLLVVCLGSLLLALELSKSISHSVTLNVCAPFTASFTQIDSLVVGSLSGQSVPIGVVLRPRAKSQVRSSVIEPVPVPVIDLSAPTRGQYETMKIRQTGLPIAARIAPSVDVGSSIVRVPTPIQRKFGVTFVVQHDVPRAQHELSHKANIPELWSLQQPHPGHFEVAP